jgi:hypothetical protein
MKTRALRGGDGSGPTVSPIGLRRRIQTMVETGVLPALAHRRSWVGQGHGEPCRLCEQPITAAHWEYEVEIAPVGDIRAHGVCFRIWAEESEALRKIA